MHLEGTVEIGAPRERVFVFLLDPRNIAPCVPGSPPVEQLDATHYRVEATVGKGFLRAKATLAMDVAEAVAPERATLLAKGGAAGGSVEATARWALSEPSAGRTLVAWSADLILGGLLASFGQSAESAARAQLDGIVACVRARIESGA